jgi:hypothetical protein
MKSLKKCKYMNYSSWPGGLRMAVGLKMEKEREKPMIARFSVVK